MKKTAQKFQGKIFDEVDKRDSRRLKVIIFAQTL